MSSTAAPSGRWQAFSRKLRAALTGDTRPIAIALAVALGIFLGCSPFYGVQTILVLACAALLRLNPVLAVLGSQVSIGPLGLGIAGAEVALGEWLRFGRWASPHVSGGLELARWLWGHALYSWAIGSALLGGSLAFAGGFLAWAVAVRMQGARQPAA